MKGHRLGITAPRLEARGALGGVLLTILAMGAVVGSPLSANAQYACGQIENDTTYNTNNTEADSFNRGNNVSVRERFRPEYEAIGLHVGAFLIYPKFTTGVSYDDNIFASHSGAVGDAIFNITPEVDFKTTWSRNALAGYVRDSQTEFFKHTNEDTNQYGAGLSGKFEFGDNALTGAVDYGRYALPRSAANTGDEISKNPIEYDSTAIDTMLTHTFNRLRLSARFDYQQYDYFNGETPGGVEVFEKNLNRDIETYTGKAEYAVSPDAAVYVSGAYNVRHYDLKPPTVAYNSSSSGYNIVGGANFGLTRLVRADVQVGYLDQGYVSPLFGDIRGISTKGQIEWFPTQLTTVTLTGLRAVGDSGIIGASGFFNTTGGVQIDHELLRNLILTANATTTENSYHGISRTDDIWSFGASADWLISRRFGLLFSYTHSDQQSSGAEAGPTFTDNRGAFSTVVKF